MDERHQFALFYKNLSNILSYKSAGIVEIHDDELWHRIVRVLRIRAGQKVVLFDECLNVRVTVLDKSFSKKEIVVVTVEQVNANQAIQPYITLMPCLLKKDAFEDVVYAAAQMGVNRIVPILSGKIQREWGDKKDRARLTNVMVSACEQAKQFVLPELCESVELEALSTLLNQNSLKAYFDPAGACFIDLLEKIRSDKPAEIILFFGPEGGLTSEEEKILVNVQFQTYALTPTVLRAREAAIVGIGGVRSVC